MLDGTEDEEKFLAAGIAGLQQNSFYMHRALVTPPPLNPNLSQGHNFQSTKLSEKVLLHNIKLLQIISKNVRIHFKHKIMKQETWDT